MDKQISVTQLFIYPVKSFAGISVEQSELDDMGLKYDRRWMVVSPEGVFITQRTVPKMSMIHTQINKGKLILSTEGKVSHEVPEISSTSKKLEVNVWNDNVLATKVGDDTDKWISDILGFDCHLVYIEDEVIRQCDLDFSEEGERTGFADGFPILIISEESLTDLNNRLESPVDMRRFRPNIVISGIEAFAEDKFSNFSINNVEMKAVKLCSRCPMPMVDPDLGERTSPEPILTLSKYRKWDNKIFFGMNIIHKNQGEISVGDEFTI